MSGDLLCYSSEALTVTFLASFADSDESSDSNVDLLLLHGFCIFLVWYCSYTNRTPDLRSLDTLSIRVTDRLVYNQGEDERMDRHIIFPPVIPTDTTRKFLRRSTKNGTYVSPGFPYNRVVGTRKFEYFNIFLPYFDHHDFEIVLSLHTPPETFLCLRIWGWKSHSSSRLSRIFKF